MLAGLASAVEYEWGISEAFQKLKKKRERKKLSVRNFRC